MVVIELKVIIFDAGGVVVERAFPAVSAKFKEKYGINPEITYSTLGRHWPLFQLGKILEDEYWMLVAADLNLEPNIAHFKKVIRQVFKVNQEVFGLAEQLAKKHVLVLLTNISREWLQHLRENYPVDQVFHHVVASCDLGIAKPRLNADQNPFEIYLKCLEIVKTTPANCILIDDHEENLVPAKQLGMQTILFKNINQLKTDLSSLLS